MIAKLKVCTPMSMNETEAANRPARLDLVVRLQACIEYSEQHAGYMGELSTMDDEILSHLNVMLDGVLVSQFLGGISRSMRRTLRMRRAASRRTRWPLPHLS